MNCEYQDDPSRNDGSSDRTGPARMTKDSRKSNQPDLFAFIGFISRSASDRRYLPESATGEETYQRICDDE